MPLETDLTYACPSCGEENAVGADPGIAGKQIVVEDCPVCCRPLVFTIVTARDGDIALENVTAEDD